MQDTEGVASIARPRYANIQNSDKEWSLMHPMSKQDQTKKDKKGQTRSKTSNNKQGTVTFIGGCMSI
jgi:hypothetical protein